MTPPVLFTILLFAASEPDPSSPPAQDGFIQGATYDAAPFAEALLPEIDLAKPRVFGVQDFSDLTLYVIDVTVDVELGTLDGREQVIFKNMENAPLKEIYFRIYPNAPYLTAGGKNIVVTYATSTDREVVMSEEGATAIKLEFKSPLEPEEKTNIRLAFKGVVPRLRDEQLDMMSASFQQLFGMMSGSGAGKQGNVKGTDYGVFSNAQGIMSLAGFYPTIPAYDEHGWDIEAPSGIGDVSYYDVSNYLVSVTADSAAVQVASGVKVGEKPAALKGHKTAYHIGTAIRDFNVILSKHFLSKSRKEGGITVNSYYVPGHEKSGEKVLSIAVEAIKLYSNMFGQYPYREFDVAEAPLTGGAGGVEFPTLCSIAKMLYGSPAEGGGIEALLAASPIFQQTIEFVVAHEVAHQWWNGIVGSDSKRFPFVDEALASYSAILYFEKRYGREAGLSAGDSQVKMNYFMYRMMGGADRPAGRAAREFESQIEYAGLVYGKAPLFFQALRQAIGDKAFFQTLRRYFTEKQFRIAGPKDIAAIASAGAPRGKVMKLYDRWINEAHGDEDLGSPDLSQLLKGIFPAEMGGLDNEEMKQIEQLLPFIQNLLGGGGTGE